MPVNRLDYFAINPEAVRAMLALKPLTPGIDPGLRALVELRISQINGCAYCIDLHGREALANGETEERLSMLARWQRADCFTAAEQAAFTWAETLTRVSQSGAPDSAYEDVRAHFGDQQVVDLTLIIAQMNAWNRIAIGFSHEP
ncbi:carboxymuconolactone decarboxylase family protein [Pontivivens insulae]|uniref:Carboxymuconolactone decarboxylase-like domain-containing protein n=1 Tax=Pontivivens insulae TaxID=1639689 RepID=A0A2R8ADK4_9RHOB|nr:carboxymuconolactone decarboxylase family protein [Pontivivens insulae]RED14084.1 AhpD family alkylhydroperoxidase [Pontivivens insulae]SPF30158.1 hypothetical protein POI8812_02492 [Pontivivens insulae]